MGKEALWKRQIAALIEKEQAMHSFPSVKRSPEELYLTPEELFWDNVSALRTRNHRFSGMGYEAGRRTAPEIGCPLYLDVEGKEDRKAKLGLIGFYVGGADAILEHYDEFLQHAISIYQNLGVLGTKHVQRRLAKYAERSQTHTTNLETALRNLAIL